MLWSIAIHDFKLTEEQFWRLTFRQFHALSKRADVELVRWDYHFGVVAATVANGYRNPKKRKKAFEPKDFVPDRKPRRRIRKTPKALLDYWRSNVLPGFKVIKKRVEH